MTIDTPNSSPAHRVHSSMALAVLINFLLELGLQATYFVGIIGGATYGLNAGPFQVSALVFVINVCFVLGGFVGGSIVDALGPKRTLLGVMLGYALYGFGGWLVGLSFAKQLALALLHGVVGGVGMAAIDVLPRYFTASQRDLLRMNSYNSTAIMVATMVGPALGGFLAQQAGLPTVFAIAAVASAPALLLCFALPARGVATKSDSSVAAEGVGEKHAVPVTTDPADLSATGGALVADDAAGSTSAQEAPSEPSRWHELFEGVRVTFQSRNLRLLFFIGFLGFFAYGAFDSLESLFYRDTLQASVDWMGLLSTLSGVGATVGSLAVARIPSRRLSLRLLSAALLVTGLGSMLYVGTSSVWIAAVGQAICGVGFGAMGPMRTTLAQRDCSLEFVGRVTAFMRAGLNSAGVVPLLVAPFLADAFGVQRVLFGAAVFVAAIACVFLALTRRI